MSRFVWVQVICLLAFVMGCATDRPFVWLKDVPPTLLKVDTAIHSRDKLAVSVRDQPALSGEFVVRDDGGVLFPIVGDVFAGGRSTDEVAEELRTRLTAAVVKPVVTVSISNVAAIRVSVVGEVKTPSTYELTRNHSVTAALAAAGWLTEFADRDRIFVVRREGDLRIRFRAREITAPTPTVASFRLRDGDVVVVE